MSPTLRSAILILLALAPLAGGVWALFQSDPEFDRGRRAYESGQFPEAFEAYSAAEAIGSNDAPQELLHNKALAALQAGKLAEAEAAAERTAALGTTLFGGFRDFVKANVAFARSERAEAAVFGLDSGPSPFDVAIAYAEAAKRGWQLAAMSRDDWPEARRNVERALLRLEELRKNKADFDKTRKNQRQPDMHPSGDPVPQPDPPSEPESPEIADRPPNEAPGAEEETAIEPELAELPASGVRRLLERLEEKEREKQRLRRAELETRRTTVERDW